MSKQALNGLTLYFNEINKAIICKADMKKDFVVKRYTLLVPVQTVNVHLTLTCSPTGTLS